MKLRHASLPVSLLTYSVFSYFLVDRNLYLASHPFYISLQRKLWHLADTTPIVPLLFAGIVIWSFVSYLDLLKQFKQSKLSQSHLAKLTIASVAALIVAYPALSYDVFNYAFNGKMVWQYHANPHQAVALDFPHDPWLRFMHNIHTPAPYGYGWTAISLIPSYIGQGSLKLSLFLFRLMMITGFAGIIWIYYKIKPGIKPFQVALFALNPLVLIETVGSIHNDVVMMMFALTTIYALQRYLKSKSIKWVLIAVLTFIFSISIKYATLMLLVGAIGHFVLKQSYKKQSFFDIQTIAHALPLATERSRRFLPWYLIWSLAFIPLTKSNLIRNIIIAASLFALLSYLPFLWVGEYTSQVQHVRQAIIFVPLSIISATLLIKNKSLSSST